MEGINKPLRVWHIPQAGASGTFYVPVNNEREASLVLNALAIQHLWLESNDIIDDYSNAMGVEMYSEASDEWEDYWNEEEGMDFDEIEENFFSETANAIHEAND